MKRCKACGRFVGVGHLALLQRNTTFRVDHVYCDWDCVAKLRKKQLEAMRDMLIIGGSR